MVGVRQRHGVEARYEYIEYLLYWHGRINRADLVDTFGISGSQASSDLQSYIKRAPDNIRYDTAEKAYRRATGFVPIYLEQTADNYLGALLAMSAGLLHPAAAWLQTIPAFHVTPTPARGVRPQTLRAVIHAVDHKLAVEILYQSMSSPDPSWRWIEPHAYAFDGFRWHIRAFCLRDQTFKDFLLSRIIETRDGQQPRPAQSNGRDDVDWSSDITLLVAAHPDLSPGQQKAIRLDYGMDERGLAEITVKRSMLYYALKRLGLDTDPSARRPQDQQIVLVNGDDVFDRKASV